MICRIAGKIINKKDGAVIVDVNGIGYEVFVPKVISDELSEPGENCELVTFHYVHLDPSKGYPVLIGFKNDIEKEFFEKFITVSGIGPKAALRCINQPISNIAQAIDSGDVAFLKSLPGIGTQRAKEIVAKLQGKLGKFGLMRATEPKPVAAVSGNMIFEEALAVLIQLQYKKTEAEQMLEKALDRNPNIKTSEELLNEIYRQRTQK